MSKLTPSGNVMNILRVFHQANTQEMQEGLLWYKAQLDIVVARVEDIFRRRRHKAGTPRPTRDMVAGITAALSPNKVWTHNIRLVEQLVRTGDAGTYKRQVAKALRILAGESPLSVLCGPKELAFYKCFVDGGKGEAVTVDGHAYSVWRGLYISTSKARVTARGYRLAADDYREVALMVGLSPAQVQAITWLTHRRVHMSKGHVVDMRA